MGSKEDPDDKHWYGTSDKCMKFIPIKVGVIIIGILCIGHAIWATYELIN